MRRTSVARLFDSHRDWLKLTHVCGRLDRDISVTEERIWPADLVGHLNLIHPDRLQIIGAAELSWARRQSRDKIAHHLTEILSAQPPAIVMADDCEVPAMVSTLCEANGIALFTTPLASASVIAESTSPAMLPAMLAATTVLAIVANLYELLCTAGFPMIFTRLLTLQEDNGVRHYLYLALYNVIYVLPLFVIVLAFVRSMGSRKLNEREGRLLKLLSGLMMIGLGSVLLLAPERLAEIGVAVALPALAIALTGLAARLTRNSG